MPKAFWNLNLNATHSGIKAISNVELQRAEAVRHVKLFLAPIDGHQYISDSMVPDYLISEGMVSRFLEIDPPLFRAMTEYDVIFNDIERSYVCGAFFSAVSASVVTIERILNVTRMELHPHVSPKIKELWGKGAIDKWQPNVEALVKWGYLSESLAQELTELYGIRCNYLHSGSLASLPVDCKRTVLAAYNLSKEIIGFPPKLFTLKDGGITCLNWEDPLVRIFYKRHLTVQEDSAAG